MIILNSIKNHYNEQYKINNLLKKRVDNLIDGIKKPHWHYFSRIKDLESYALKMETGRFNVDHLEDFFACTIVVKDNNEINDVKEIIKKFYDECYARPKKADYTHKDASSFVFDDLRSYGKLKNNPKLPSTSINNVLFEIQIKTFLQHAWTLATYDRTYKSKKNDWGEMRIAYQIKAMLENIELSISQIDTIKKSTLVKKSNPTLQRYEKIENILTEYWIKALLPKNEIRSNLIQNIDILLEKIKVTPNDIDSILKNEKKHTHGLKKSLPPYFGILQLIIQHKKFKIESFLKNNKSRKFKLVIPCELDYNNPYVGKNQRIVKID